MSRNFVLLLSRPHHRHRLRHRPSCRTDLRATQRLLLLVPQDPRSQPGAPRPQHRRLPVSPRSRCSSRPAASYRWSATECCLYLVFAVYGVRLLVNSFIRNPWMAIATEMTQSLCNGLFFPAASLSINALAPPECMELFKASSAPYIGASVSIRSHLL